MNLEQFLNERLKKEEIELMNTNSKIERIEESKEENKLVKHYLKSLLT